MDGLNYSYGNELTNYWGYMGLANPFRYRGYYYDEETGFYYLNSRYYDQRTCRFINADGYVSTGQGILGTNMFAYCENNPVNRVDPSGECWLSAVLVTLGVVFISTMLTADTSDETIEAHNVQKQTAVEKFNDTTVNVYTPETGKKADDKVNVFLNPKNKKKGKDNPNIQIENSYKITNHYEMEAVLNVVIENELYDTDIYTRNIGSYIKEWEAHNLGYAVFDCFGFEFLANKAKHVDLDNRDTLILLWDCNMKPIIYG